MDPFQKLPPEICQHILFQAETREELVNLSHASPTMLGQRVDQLGRAIQLYCRKLDFCDDRLQDAIAILLFPKRTSNKEGTGRDYWDRVHRHLEQWASRDLPDPTWNYDIYIMDKLESLCIQLEYYTKDFLSKATSPHLRQAYIHLPKWSHPSFKDNMGSLPPQAEDAIDLYSLSPGKKKRILKAFLRYEILAKIFRPQLRHTWSRHDRVHIENQTSYAKTWWDWNILDRYQRKSSELWETEGLQCVFEYFRTVYCAISARFDGMSIGLQNWFDGWPPILAEHYHNRHVQRLSSSDSMNVGFKAPHFTKNNTTSTRLTWVGIIPTDTLFDVLALGGIDQSIQLLMAGKDYSERFFDSAAGIVLAGVKPFDLRGLGPVARVMQGIEDGYWKEAVNFGPGVWSRLKPWEFYDHDAYDYAHKALLCTYRQRAWAFFDDERCYPETCRFHTLQEMERMMYGGLEEALDWRPRAEAPRLPYESQQQIKEACENSDMWLLSPTAAYLTGRES